MTVLEFSERNRAAGYEFRTLGNDVVGVYKGYPFSLSIRTKSNQHLVSIKMIVEGGLNGKVLKAIRAGLPKRSTTVALQGGGFLATVNAGEELDAFPTTMAAFEHIIYTLSTAKKPCVPPAKCPLCRSKEPCDSAALMADGYRPVHMHCVIAQGEQQASTAVRNQGSGNYLLAFFGALIGAIIGSLPNMLLISFLEVEWGVIYYLIPIAAYWAYKRCNGKLGNGARVIVILTSIIAYFLSRPLMYYVYLMQSGASMSLLSIVKFYYLYTPISDLLAENWFGIVFLIIGLASCFKSIGETNHDVVSAVGARVTSLISLDGTILEPQQETEVVAATTYQTYTTYTDTSEKPPMEIDL